MARINSMPMQDRQKLDKILEAKARLAEQLAPPPTYSREGHFRFMDLPAELRTYIYAYLFPLHKDISFHFLRLRSGHEWMTLSRPRAARKETDTEEDHQEEQRAAIGYDPMKKRRVSDGQYVHSRGWLSVETQVLRVSKTVASEAKAVLYGSNTYRFSISGDTHHPISLHSPLIFGPFGADLTDRLPLLRNLRSIHLDVTIDENSHWAAQRHFSRLEYFVSILKQHSDDANRRSLLEEFTVHMHDSRFSHNLGLVRYLVDRTPLMNIDRFIFGLEPLAQLTGIKKVKVQGVPEWFAECLQLCISGQGGEVRECEWPMVKVKTSVNGMYKKRKWVWKSARKWWQPRMNWKEFADRNGVECPEDVESFWMDES